MSVRSITLAASALALLGGCAATIDQDGLEQRTAQTPSTSVTKSPTGVTSTEPRASSGP